MDTSFKMALNQTVMAYLTNENQFCFQTSGLVVISLLVVYFVEIAVDVHY